MRVSNADLPGARLWVCHSDDGKSVYTDIEASAWVLLGCKKCPQHRGCPGPDVAEGGEGPKLPENFGKVGVFPDPFAASPQPKKRARKTERKGRKTEREAPEPEQKAPDTERIAGCRAALMELAANPYLRRRKKDAGEIVALFREEIAAARAVGWGWRTISKALRQSGYDLGANTVQKNFK